MEGDAVSATIGVLVQNLIDVSKNEISLIRGLDKEADNLQSTLSTIQSLLDDAQKKSIDDAVKKWLQELEGVVFEADNVLDELSYRSLAKKMKTLSRTDKKKVASCFPSFNHFLHRRQSAFQIKEINVKFESINKRATTLGLERRLAEAPVAPDNASIETDGFTVDPFFIGRDVIVSEIVERLKRPTEQALSILPIVGMGGLGKTTLARKVFNHEKIKTYFEQQIWVHVSQIFDVVTLFRKILISLKPKELQVEISRESLLKMIQEALGSKSYVLVLDDVWNQDRQKLEDFINSWSGVTSVKRNCILVTTRNNEVGSIVNSNGIHNLNGLSEGECWSIIKEKAFKRGDIPWSFEAIGRSIAQRCHGLPLAANVVGGMLCGKPLDGWRKIEHNWLSYGGEDEDNISKILKLSYDHLSSPSLKKCFAYCSVFPKGSTIEREDLIQCWMAEGFLQSNEMEDQGNKLVDLLVESSLLQVVDRDDFNNIQNCSMHDLVHDVAGSVLGFFRGNDNTSNGSCGARYILWESKRDESSHIKKEQSKWVRTLLYNGDLCEIIFSEFKSLHVLILVGNIVELSDTIRELIHLRFLNITETRIRTLPDSVGELYQLQTFKACYSLNNLPSTFKYLSNLRHLDLDDDTVLPPHMGMLSSLQTLRYFKVRDEEGYRIVELGSLQNLKGKLCIYDLEKVQGEDESKEACLSQKSGIIKLALSWDKSREGGINDKSVLNGLQPHSNLKILKIVGFKEASFPSWTLKMEGLDNLMKIKLESCSECTEIPMLGHLSFLKSVKLSYLENVTFISSSFYGVNNCSSNNVFPALETLVLNSMSKLEEWVEIPNDAEVKVFPCLKILKIKDCNKLKSAPTTFPSLEQLEIKGMDSGVPLANIFANKLTSLVELSMRNVVEVAGLPDWLFHSTHSLSVLEINGCNKLRDLPTFETLNSLEELTIENCNSLESIPTLGYLARLKSIKLFYLDNVKSLSSSFYGTDKCSSNNVFPVLERLELDMMSKLEEWVEAEIPNGAEVKVFPCLKILKIWHCDNLKSAPTTFSCLKELCIYRMDSGVPLENICGIKLTSLINLVIISVGHMVSLPDWLFHNNQSLSVLEIEECPELRGLPDGLQTLKSLEKLKIKNCDNLESIPFSSRRQSQGCPLLRLLSFDSRTGINVPCELLESCSKSLTELYLNKVSNMPMAIECIHKMPHLTKLDMSSVSKFIISSSPTEVGSLCSLKRLEFSPDESWDSVSFNNAIDGILRMAPPSFQKLDLKGYEDWESLPDQLQHLTALEVLYLNKFGIEELPEWFGNISSLQILIVGKCKKLKRQPFVEAIQRLTNLTDLGFGDCPLLEEGGGIEQQIHVPNLWVNGWRLRYDGVLRVY